MTESTPKPLQFRQGDVFLRRVKALPHRLREVPRDGGRIILAYGETTGHAHAIDAPEAEAALLTADQERRFLRLMSDVTLVHEEHAPITLPAGLYEVIRQREWTDAAARADEEAWNYVYD